MTPIANKIVQALLSKVEWPTINLDASIFRRTIRTAIAQTVT